MTSENSSSEKKKIWNTIKDDFKNIKVEDDLRLGFSEVFEFYFDKSQKAALKEMKWYKKIWTIPLWLFNILFYKLTHFRRVLLIASIALLILFSMNNRFNSGLYLIFSYITILFIIILELKDKLIASNELKAGRLVQKAFSPQKNFSVPGWEAWLYSRPANSVGGDMVDVVQIDENRYGLSLGDVSGKELGAALYMVKLQSTLRAIVSDSASLSDLGRKINSIFFRDSETSRFATMVYFEISPDSKRVSLLNAGHLPPIFFRNDEMRDLDRGGNAFGIKMDSEYSEMNFEMDKDDLLIVYSDGVTEAMNDQGAFFGKDALERTLKNLSGYSAQEVGEVLLQHVESFIGNAKVSDDLSIITLRKR